MGALMGICAWTPLELFAVSLGLTNIVLWLFAQAPQIWLNWKRKQTEAISIKFLIIWLTGDITNLIASFLTQQLPIQRYTAIYFCFVDFILVSQWIYYTKISVLDPAKAISPLIQTHEIRQKYGIIYFLVVSNIITLPLLLQHTHSSHWDYSPATSRELLQLSPEVNGTSLPHCEFKPQLENWLLTFGDVCAWISGILYFIARIPQIIRNYRRKTVKGLSMSMFVFMNLANICYGVYMLILIKDFRSEKFIRADFPFLLGSLGTVITNTFVLVQWYYYDIYLYIQKNVHDEYQFV
jgi:uncharacterized protein with PQ loop repeat